MQLKLFESNGQVVMAKKQYGEEETERKNSTSEILSCPFFK